MPHSERQNVSTNNQTLLGSGTGKMGGGGFVGGGEENVGGGW